MEDMIQSFKVPHPPQSLTEGESTKKNDKKKKTKRTKDILNEVMDAPPGLKVTSAVAEGGECFCSQVRCFSWRVRYTIVSR